MNLSLKTLLAACALVLGACATQRDIQPSLHRTETGLWGLNDPGPAPALPPFEPWWKALGDSVLDGLIEQALASQPNLQVVQARLARAQAQAVAARGAALPQAQASAEVDRQRYPEHGLIPPPFGGTTQTIGTLQLEGHWELDLFGRQRALLDAAIGQSRAAQADAQAARVMLSAQVASAYVQLARLLAQRDLAQRTLQQRQDVLGLIRQRVSAGLDTHVELRQGEGALPDSRQQIEAVGEQIALTRHALAALTGQPPASTVQLSPDLRALRNLPVPNAVPVDLLARRADVTAALWRAEAAGHAVDAARALFYPNVDLRGFVGYNAIGLGQLLEAGSRQWGLLPAIHLPLFDGDQRRAGLQGQVADQDASVALYNQTLVDAVREVADQLSSVDSVTRQRAEQRDAEASAEGAYALALQRYRAGLGTYLIVLNAESAVLNQRRLGVDLQARAVDAQVALVHALGGAAGVADAPASSSSLSHKNADARSAGDRS